VHDLTARGIGFMVLTGQGASIDTTFPGGKLVFGIFAALAEFERELIIERTKAGMAAARARGRNGGRPYKMAPSKLRLAVASMNQPETRIGDLCAELGITLRMLRSILPMSEKRNVWCSSRRRPHFFTCPLIATSACLLHLRAEVLRHEFLGPLALDVHRVDISFRVQREAVRPIQIARPLLAVFPWRNRPELE
jgi:hypothetical protein